MAEHLNGYFDNLRVLGRDLAKSNTLEPTCGCVWRGDTFELSQC